MVIRPAKQVDLPHIKYVMERCGLIVEGVNYDDWTGWLLVAERQGEIIALIHVIPSKPYAIVAEFGVLPEFRKGRAAHKLIEAAELMMRMSGYSEWCAFIGFDKNGFHETVANYGAKRLGDGSMYRREL